MRILLIVLLLGSLAASAQTLRDQNGNLLGRYEHQGDRTNFRDKNGNLEGYSVTRNGRTEFRDKNGNLKATETQR